ncbi:MAG: hypothetical protein K9N06_14090 [Candidatus Cloacimonetes bacterium]|nr:hypothetical protein [Candidatus Cloacimonadota bacterium]
MEKEFRELLSMIGNKLPVKEPEKSRILLEIASDMSDTYELLLSQNKTPADARGEVCRRFAFSESELAELSSVYLTSWQRVFSAINHIISSPVEKVIFLAVMFLVAIISGRYFFSTGFFRLGNIFSYLSLICLLGSVSIFFKKLYDLFVRRDFEIKRLRQGLSFLEFSGIIIFICALQILLEKTVSVSAKLVMLLQDILSPVTDAGTATFYGEILKWGIDLSLLEINMIIMLMLIIFMRFLLENLISRIEQAAAELIMQVKK